MAIYYVKNGGNDSLDGLSDGNAWATISKVNSASFNAGDSVLFNAGDTWREMLTVTRSGTSGAYMHFGRYGTGNNPRILGSKTTTWTNQSGNVWKSDQTFTNPYAVGAYGAEIFFENTNDTVAWGIHKANTGALTAEYHWTWASNYIYVYAASDPNTRYISVEIPQRKDIIDLNNKNYIHIDGIDVFYCGEVGITIDTDGATPFPAQTGLIIENLEIAYVSIKDSEYGYGTEAVYSNMIVRHCEVHDCGRRPLSFHLYATNTVTNILVEDCKFYNGWHTTGPDFSVGNYAGGKIDGVIVRRCLIYDDPQRNDGYADQIFLQNYLYSTLQSELKNVYIYSNIFVAPAGGASINTEGVQSVYIYNNTFYNFNQGGSGSSGHMWVDANNDLVHIKNNIFYSTLSTNTPELFIRSYGRNISNMQVDGNMYYKVSNSYRIVEDEDKTSYYMNTLADLRTNLGWELNGYAANPQMTDPANGDFSLAEGSPAINAGLDLNLELDYAGNPFHPTTPSIGAMEYGSVPENILVTSITVSGAGGASIITTQGGTLQLSASVLPEDATDKTITWSRTNGTGQANISSGGLVTAVADGTVTARATANDGSGIYDDMIITISNQGDPVPGIYNYISKVEIL